MPGIYLISLVIIITIHFMMALVTALYARYKVQYLSLAWIMGIFATIYCLALPFLDKLQFQNVGILHPFMLLALVITTFLQSIFPLSIPMPAFLQWKRMWKYATPAITLITLYILSLLLGNRPHIVLSYNQILSPGWGIDMFFRIAGLLLAIYYVANILRLPRQMARNTQIPRYLKGFVSALGLSLLFYVYVAVCFSPTLLLAYFYISSLLNLYLFLRTLETMAIRLPNPEMHPVDDVENLKETEKSKQRDFNQTNLSLFHRAERYMQHSTDYLDNTFTRDNLCRETGINRHLMLQCLRSQGYNNCHEYINTYRVAAIKQGILQGQLKSVADCCDKGFGSPRTARTSFQRIVGISLDDFIAQYNPEPKNNAQQ